MGSTISLNGGLRSLINTLSRDNESNTPDYILADFLEACLLAGEKLIKAREKHPMGDIVRYSLEKEIERIMIYTCHEATCMDKGCMGGKHCHTVKLIMDKVNTYIDNYCSERCGFKEQALKTEE